MAVAQIIRHRQLLIANNANITKKVRTSIRMEQCKGDVHSIGLTYCTCVVVLPSSQPVIFDILLIVVFKHFSKTFSLLFKQLSIRLYTT